ncbi:YlzJ-like family protein [Shouchella shacheensis]|uniref:YlzJ-like family protein n=1 Tax=Shouchella shacheensis TaxID=1649580 RepID=UPI00073FB1C8|nr:YlzJ-like family protein [Shouchella shacheensis]
MILYTLMPTEQIFPEEENVFESQKVMDCEGGQLVVEQVNGGDFRVVRLISSDPNQFLNPSYAPGTIIQAKPTLL